MKLKSRLDRIERVMGGAALFDGRTVADLAIYGFFDGSSRDRGAPNGVHRLATAVSLGGMIPHLLNKPEQLRRKIEETRRSDEYRAANGFPILLTPERLEAWQDQVARSEEKAARLRQSLGLQAGTSPEELAQTLLRLAEKVGLNPKELAAVEERLRGDSCGQVDGSPRPASRRGRKPPMGCVARVDVSR